MRKAGSTGYRQKSGVKSNCVREFRSSRGKDGLFKLEGEARQAVLNSMVPFTYTPQSKNSGCVAQPPRQIAGRKT